MLNSLAKSICRFNIDARSYISNRLTQSSRKHGFTSCESTGSTTHARYFILVATMYSQPLCMCVATRPGTNSEESVTNLRNWIDLVARQCLPPCSFVSVSQGIVLKGVYHHLKSSELQRFIGELAIRCQDWEAQCIANQKSCGWAVQADGSGAGKVTMTSIMLGPFRNHRYKNCRN